MIEHIAPVAYKFQTDGNLCGAAAAQMVLGRLGAAAGDQTVILADIQNLADEDERKCEGIAQPWDSEPTGLARSLNHLSASSRFSVRSSKSENTISRRVIWTAANDVGTPVLVFGGAHWVVVFGYRTTDVPTSATDKSYDIDSIFMHDPEPNTGTLHVPADEWTDVYLWAVCGGQWNGRYVAVCGEPLKKPRRKPKAKKSAKAVGEVASMSSSSASNTPHGKSIVDPQEAMNAANRAVLEQGLERLDPWRDPLARGAVRPPFLVQQIDLYDRYYFVTPWMTGDQVVAMVRVDAETVGYLGAAAPHKSFTLIDPAGAIDLVADRPIRRDPCAKAVYPRRHGIGVHPTLVWKPCAESLSPFLPFYKLTLGQGEVFVRIDGAVVTMALSPPRAGS